MSKKHVASELALRSRENWARYVERRGLIGLGAHDQKLEKVR